ncbi:MAG: cyclase family protein [Dehalococcoidia bacterium]
MTTAQATSMSAQEFVELFEQTKNWGRWGADDQRGALNLISNEKRARAAKLVSEGFIVSAANPVPVLPGPNNPRPALRAVIRGGDIAGEGVDSASDLTLIAPHGFATSHMDALCHVFWNRQMYNGYPAAKMGTAGAELNGIEVAREGVVSRGVLLDIPRLLGKEYLGRGEAIFIDDLEAAEAKQGVRVEEGDILLVRTGRHLRERTETETPLLDGGAGLHARAMPWLRTRGVAVLGSDGVSDVFPSGVEGNRLPVHVSTLVGMGIHLLDNLALENLAGACATHNRWEFQFVVAPLVIEKGTGSAVNPIAIF